MNQSGHPDGSGADELTQSPAFRAASLRTEVRRAYAVIGVIVTVFVLVFLRWSTLQVDRRLVFAGVMGIAVLFALQFGVLGVARWAATNDRRIPTWFVAGTVVIESLVPTGIIFANFMSGTLAPFASLVSPPVLAYGLMIMLTTLRLRPWLCVMAGAIGSASYLAVLLYVLYGLDLRRSTTGLPMAGYFNAGVLVFVSGLAGAWVAREFRRHAQAALREAETRRQMARIEQDLAVARSIQQALLPRTAPDIPGYEIVGWNRPADLTGGDYYDWQRMPDGNWIITLADVSGHGIGPAMVTAACRAYVRASSATHPELGSLASRINRLLSDDLPDGRFITMASVLVDPSRDSLALLSAGHGPIVLYLGSTGAVEDILPHDLPLAVMPDTTFGPAQVVQMKPGDVLALVTDGFVEWSRPDPSGQREEFGLDRLRESLRRHAHRSPDGMIQAITADVAEFAGAERQQDDLTMVIIRRNN